MQKASILIVEDEIIIAYDIQYKLQSLGFQVCSICTSGKQAIEGVQKYAPDLVLMDIRLKGKMTGIEAADCISKDHDVPVIYLTAHTDNNTLDKAKHTHPYGYLVKPIDNEQSLLAPIEIALHKHEMESILRERESWFASTLQSIEDAIITTDRQGNITVMNPKAVVLTGYSQAEAASQFLESLVPLVSGNRSIPVSEWMQLTIESANVQELPPETVLVNKNDRTCFIEGTISPIYSPKGTVAGAVLAFRDITQRKQSEDALRRERNLFNRITEASPAGIVMVNKDGRIHFANNQAEKVLGLSKDHIEQRDYNDPQWKIMDIEGQPFDSGNLPFTVVKRTLKGIRNIEHLIQWADGRRVMLSINAEPLFDHENAFDGMVATVEDITLRHLTEKALRESEEKFRSILQNLNDLIWILDDHYIIQFVTDSCQTVLGYTIEQILCISIFDRIHPDDMDLVRKQMKQIENRSDEIQPFELRMKHLSGHWIIMELVGNNQLDNPAIRGIILSGRDITERRQIEASLRESQERLKLALEGTNDGLWDYSPKANTVYFSARWFSMLGYPPFSLPSTMDTWKRLLHPEDAPDAKKALNQFVRSNRDFYTNEYRLRTADGEYRYVLSRGKAVERDKNGRITRMVGTITDITEQKEADARIRESETKFRQIVESSPMGMHMYRLDGRNRLIFTGANPAADTILGIPNDQFIGKTLEQAFPPLAKTEIPAKYRDVCKKGIPYNAEQITYKHGQIDGAFDVHAFLTAPGMMTVMFVDVTDRKRIEDRLRMTRYSINHVGEGAFWINRDAMFIDVNETASQMLEYTREELLKMKMSDIQPSFRISRWKAYWKELKEKNCIVTETVQITKTGRKIPVEMIGNYLEYENTEYNFTVVRNIEERQKTLHALQESEHKLSLLARNYRGIAYQVQIRGKNNFVLSHLDGELERLTGYPAEYFQTGKLHWNQLIHPDDAASVNKEEHNIATLSEYTADNEYRIITRSGEIRWVRDIARMIDSEDIPMFQGSIFDVTERVQAEIALRESEEKYRSLVELASDGIVIIENDRIRFANNRIFEMLNVPASTLINSEWLNYVVPEDRNQMTDYYRRRLQGDSAPRTFETRILDKNLQILPVEISAGRIPFQNRDAFLVFVRDIRERKTAEMAMQQAQRTYHLASLGTLAAGISHEINQPLTALKLKVDGLLYWGDENPEILQKNLKKNLQFITDQADEINKIIRHMRSLIYQEKTPPEPIHVNQTIHKACRFMEQRLMSHHIELDLKLTKADPVVMAIETPLEQIILNLMTNAINALDRQPGKDKKIIIATKIRTEICIIDVMDNGPGIPESDLSRIFDPLFTTEKDGKGMGLGLAIVEELLKQFKGSIKAENCKEGGACMEVKIPIHHSDGTQS
ncbi:PAS domain S-box protein [bacterium]|nr:PAS domain S-box protein [bacterium]